MEVPDRIQRTWGFRFPVRRKGKKPLDLAAVLKKKIQPAFKSVGILGVGWHTFRHTVGTMLADMGEHQLTIRDYLRHSNLHVTNKYLQATSQSKRLAQGKLVDAILPSGLFPKGNSNSVVGVLSAFGLGKHGAASLLIGPKRPLIFFWVCCKCLKIWRGRRDSNPRPLP